MNRVDKEMNKLNKSEIEEVLRAQIWMKKKKMDTEREENGSLCC